MRNIFGDGDYVFLQGRRLTVEEKEVYLEKENMFFLRRRRMAEKEKEDRLQEVDLSGSGDIANPSPLIVATQKPHLSQLWEP